MKKKKIYIICPVRNITLKEKATIDLYVTFLENSENEVFLPYRDAPQANRICCEIVIPEVKAISESNEVHIFWNRTSEGSHFDLGVVFYLKKLLILINNPEDIEGKSYLKVIKEVIEEQKG